MSGEYIVEPEVTYTSEIRETWNIQLHDDPMSLHLLVDIIAQATPPLRTSGAEGTFRFIDPDQLVIAVTRPYHRAS